MSEGASAGAGGGGRGRVTRQWSSVPVLEGAQEARKKGSAMNTEFILGVSTGHILGVRTGFI